MAGSPNLRFPDFLIVDDDQVSVMAIQRGLRKLSDEISTQIASDGREALSRLKARAEQGITAPLLITLDLNMPRMSGLEFLLSLRSTKGAIHPVFVYSTSDVPTDITAAYELGAAGYIIKKSDPAAQHDALELLVSYARNCAFP